MNEYIDTKYIILNAGRNESERAYALCYTSLHLIEPLISVLSFNFLLIYMFVIVTLRRIMYINVEVTANDSENYERSRVDDI